MKATGIVRRVDELGRIVIPKEIRRTMHFRQGDPIEIFTDKEGSIVLKKYSALGDVEEVAKEYANSLNHTLGITAVITDKDSVVAVSGENKKNYIGKNVSSELLKKIEGRRGIITDNSTKNTTIPIIENDTQKYASQCILPIISYGDVFGAVIVSSENKSLNETYYKNAETAAYFLGTQIQ